MRADTFVKYVRENVARINTYSLGGDGTGGKCDCIGLIIGAVRLAGEKWTGTHGSNYAARNEMRTLGGIPGVAALSVGDIVYKVKAPTEDGYALPTRYNGHPDKLDYYHVGVVTSINPFEITHCTGVKGGIKRDKSLGNWEYFGQLEKIDDEDRIMGESKKYIVIGGRLKMRNAPNANGSIARYLPNGAVVIGRVLAEKKDWAYCTYDGDDGYCMTEFLEEINQPCKQAEGVTLTEQQYAELVDCMKKMQSIIDNVKK